jgi:hypothetical protein
MSYTITLDSILNNSNVVALKEKEDKELAQIFLNPNKPHVIQPLYQWLSTGSTSQYVFNTFLATVPSTCYDGVQRDFPDYFQYLTNNKFSDVQSTMSVKFSTFNLSYISTLSSISVCVNPT